MSIHQQTPLPADTFMKGKAAYQFETIDMIKRMELTLKQQLTGNEQLLPQLNQLRVLKSLKLKEEPVKNIKCFYFNLKDHTLPRKET